MLKHLKEPHTDYVFSLSGNRHKSKKVAIEWYITASDVLSVVRYRQDGRFACTNWSLEQAVQDYPNHPVVKQMLEINNMYANQELPPLILALVQSWGSYPQCTTRQR